MTAWRGVAVPVQRPLAPQTRLSASSAASAWTSFGSTRSITRASGHANLLGEGSAAIDCSSLPSRVAQTKLQASAGIQGTVIARHQRFFPAFSAPRGSLRTAPQRHGHRTVAGSGAPRTADPNPSAGVPLLARVAADGRRDAWRRVG